MEIISKTEHTTAEVKIKYCRNTTVVLENKREYEVTDESIKSAIRSNILNDCTWIRIYEHDKNDITISFMASASDVIITINEPTKEMLKVIKGYIDSGENISMPKIVNSYSLQLLNLIFDEESLESDTLVFLKVTTPDYKRFWVSWDHDYQIWKLTKEFELANQFKPRKDLDGSINSWRSYVDSDEAWEDIYSHVSEEGTVIEVVTYKLQ